MEPADFAFLQRFPGGLQDELWLSMGKKHKPDNIIKALNTELSKKEMSSNIKKKDYKTICDTALKILRRASVISVFEKMAFRNYLEHEEVQKDFCKALFDFMYNFNEESFRNFTLVLARFKSEKNSNCAKWTIVSFFKAYQDPNEFVFVKPTTTKAIAKALETEIDYSPYPTYNTYMKVHDMIYEYREKSILCKDETLMITEAILYCAVKL